MLSYRHRKNRLHNTKIYKLNRTSITCLPHDTQKLKPMRQQGFKQDIKDDFYTKKQIMFLCTELSEFKSQNVLVPKPLSTEPS